MGKGNFLSANDSGITAYACGNAHGKNELCLLIQKIQGGSWMQI